MDLRRLPDLQEVPQLRARVRAFDRAPHRHTYEAAYTWLRDYYTGVLLTAYVQATLSRRAQGLRTRLGSRRGREPCVLDAPAHGDGARASMLETVAAATAAEPLPAARRLEDVPAQRPLAAAVETLTPRQRQVVFLTVCRALTEADAASRLGTSQQNVSKVKRAALRRLRYHLLVQAG